MFALHTHGSEFKIYKDDEKIKLHLFALCATLVLVSCGGSDDDPVFNNTSAVYKVVLEASGMIIQLKLLLLIRITYQL